MSAHRFHILTGGPGSGKTTLIEAMAGLGYRAMPEAGRAVIRDQQAIGGWALPWGDRALFAELMLAHNMRSLAEAEDHGGPVLFDRGVPDVLGYLRLCGLAIPPHVEAAARGLRYAPTVFLAPFWPEIFQGDAERRQSPEEAEATARMMGETYDGLGYSVVTLPKAPVPERIRFLAERIGPTTGSD